jgi:nucleoside-diphosphate-sugar epimerase
VSDTCDLVTGATGLLGSHIAELLVRRGRRVRALVRPGSDVAFLNQLGVELARGDLGDPESLGRAAAGANRVYHCAAHVGDWGPWRLFRRSVVDATRNLLDACVQAGVGRVLHVSSIIVYGHPRLDRREGEAPAGPFTEDEPLGRNLWWWDHYCRAKVKAEQLYRHYPGEWTVVRPSWIYGPRDRNTLPRLLQALRAGSVALVGTGDNLLNLLHAEDVADGAIRAAEHPGAVGRAYNLSCTGEITQRHFLKLLTDALGLPPVTRRMQVRQAHLFGFLYELVGRALKLSRPPRLTRYAVALMRRSTRYSVARARQELGWRPHVDPIEGVRRCLARHHQACPGGALTGG